MNHAIYVIDGKHYRWSGWFGCQLRSYELRRAKAGTEREILGRKFRVFSTGKRTMRGVDTTWCLVGIDGQGIDHANARIRQLRADLKEL